MVLSSLRAPGLGHALGAICAIGVLGLFAATGTTCGNAMAPTNPSTLAPIMATSPAHAPLTATDRKCAAK
ncbi:hypothetical protein WKW77_20845 [Variovorax ureilyticus]|uniref:Uncharacterized protein n=1 Tax=Variovorax ureilyticus TaxID=1836198 RepID=A0ABU8VIW6_9BURK